MFLYKYSGIKYTTDYNAGLIATAVYKMFLLYLAINETERPKKGLHRFRLDIYTLKALT